MIPQQTNSSQQIFTLSNFLSLARIFLLIPILYYLHLGQEQPSANLTALILMLIGAVTDILDGWLARKMKQVTNLGRILDPIADKIGIGIVFLFLALTRNDFPLWFVLVVIARDVLIFFTGLLIRIRHHFVFESNMIGKITVTILFLYLISYITKDFYALADLVHILLWVSIGFILISLISYTLRLVDFFKRINTPSDGGSS